MVEMEAWPESLVQVEDLDAGYHGLRHIYDYCIVLIYHIFVIQASFSGLPGRRAKPGQSYRNEKGGLHIP